jgi:hypothetical protein
MSDSPSLSELLLKQEALFPGTASTLVLEQIRRQQAKDDARERFWFRMACGFWIAAGVCVSVLAILVGGEVRMSAISRPAAPPAAIARPAPPQAAGVEEKDVPVRQAVKPAEFHIVESGLTFDPIRTTGMAALTLAPIAILGGLFSSAWLMLTRRRASRANLQLTLAALSSEIRELARQRAAGDEK